MERGESWIEFLRSESLLGKSPKSGNSKGNVKIKAEEGVNEREKKKRVNETKADSRDQS